MKPKIGIVSLRFNPAFIQHLVAFIKMIQEMGHDAVSILDPSYNRFAEIQELAKVIDPKSDLGSLALTHAVFLNASPANLKAASTLKSSGTRIFYVLHEPKQPAFKFWWAEGPAIGTKGLLAHYLSVPLIKLADTILLASRFAVDTYDRSDRRYNHQRIYFPLIYDDEAPVDIAALLPNKHHFGFIGGLCRAHGFDQYLRFMREELRKKSELKFLIASKHPLAAKIQNDPLIRENTDRLTFRCGRPLSNDEMNQAYADCFCIWNVYRRSTQSGVLPRAFMFGTPVLASTVGSFPEFVQDRVNGRFVDNLGHDAIAEMLREIRANLSNYALNCRNGFREHFFYRTNAKLFQQIL